MAEFEPLNMAAKALEAMATRMREAVRPAETLIENKANNVVYTISELLDELSAALKRLHCIAETTGAEGGKVKTICTSWRMVPSGEDLLLIRTKPETVIALRNGRFFFHRDSVRMEAEGNRVKLCKWSYCKEFSAANRDEIIEELPQILYLLRHVANALRKSGDAVLVCAKEKAPSCVRI